MKKLPLNKLQLTVIILSCIGLYLLFGKGGVSLSSNHPIRIAIYLIAIIALIIVIYLAVKPRYCPRCHTRLPIFRKPKNVRQAMFGGWTCPKCGAELDSSGNLIEANK